MSGGAPTLLRCVVIGPGGVGKSSVTVRFVKDVFQEKYDPTVENSYTKDVKVSETQCKMDILDTAGQEEYSSLRDAYIRSSQGLLLIYDITSRKSFDSARRLYETIRRIKEDEKDAPVIFVANKVDLESQRKVTTEEGQKFATAQRLKFFEVSAKGNINIEPLFQALAQDTLAWVQAHPPKNAAKQSSGGCVLM